MRIEARLSGEELRMAVEALLPMTVQLGDDPSSDRRLTLGHPMKAVIVRDRGLEVRCSAVFRWSNALEFHLDELACTLVPTIEARDGRPVLALRLEVAKSDFARLPDLVDAGIAKVLDRVLDAHPVVVEVGKFLTHVFPIPERVAPRRSVALVARQATCVVDVEGFRLGVVVDVGLAT